MEPIHQLNSTNSLFFSLLPIAHIPLLVLRISANHLKPVPTSLTQQPMTDTSWNDHQIALLNRWLVPSWILFPAEAQTSAPGDNAQDLMCRGMKVRLREHAVDPLRLDFTNILQVFLELRWRCVEGPVVNQ